MKHQNLQKCADLFAIFGEKAFFARFFPPFSGTETIENDNFSNPTRLHHGVHDHAYNCHGGGETCLVAWAEPLLRRGFVDEVGRENGQTQ